MFVRVYLIKLVSTFYSEKVFRRTDSLQERNVLYVEKEIEVEYNNLNFLVS